MTGRRGGGAQSTIREHHPPGPPHRPQAHGQHLAVIVAARIVSPGVVRDTINKPACLPEGWLQ